MLRRSSTACDARPPACLPACSCDPQCPKRTPGPQPCPHSLTLHTSPSLPCCRHRQGGLPRLGAQPVWRRADLEAPGGGGAGGQRPAVRHRAPGCVPRAQHRWAGRRAAGPAGGCSRGGGGGGMGAAGVGGSCGRCGAAADAPVCPRCTCLLVAGGMEKPRDDHKATHNMRLATRDKLFGGTVSRLQVRKHWGCLRGRCKNGAVGCRAAAAARALAAPPLFTRPSPAQPLLHRCCPASTGGGAGGRLLPAAGAG